MNADGMTYYTNQDFNTWKYKDVFSESTLYEYWFADESECE